MGGLSHVKSPLQLFYAPEHGSSWGAYLRRRHITLLGHARVIIRPLRLV